MKMKGKQKKERNGKRCVEPKTLKDKIPTSKSKLNQ